MKKLTVDNKVQIKELLLKGHILGVKDGQYSSFGGFQIWWYNDGDDSCHSCESHWIDTRKQVKSYRTSKAAKLLWHNRESLYLYTKHMSNEKKYQILDIFGQKKHTVK